MTVGPDHLQKLLDELEFEARFVMVAAGEILADRPIEWDSFQRLVQAQERIETTAAALRQYQGAQP